MPDRMGPPPGTPTGAPPPGSGGGGGEGTGGGTGGGAGKPSPARDPNRWKVVAVDWTRDRLLDDFTLRRETCTTLCISADGELSLTDTRYGSGSDCTPLGCSPGRRRFGEGHTHPAEWLGGYPGHHGLDIRRPRRHQFLSWIGLRRDLGSRVADYIYFYDYRTDTETYMELPRPR
jgi:hypothetical protein